MGSVVDLKKRATLLAQTATVLNRNRRATVAAILLISGGSYSYYLKILAAAARKRKHKYVNFMSSSGVQDVNLFYVGIIGIFIPHMLVHSSRSEGELARETHSVMEASPAENVLKCCFPTFRSQEVVIGTKANKGRKNGKSGDALKKLLNYLLPIAGKRVLLLLGLAVVRTAFSNRLARMQVGTSATLSANLAKQLTYPAVMPQVESALKLGASGVQGFMFRAAFLRKVPLFIRNFTENVVLCLAAAAVESTSNRFLQLLKLDWRNALTSRVHKQYFDQMVHQ